MGATLSAPQSSKTSSSSSSQLESDPNSQEPTPQQETSNPLLEEPEPTPQRGGEVEEEEDEEEGECGFCLYMKGGGCREQFVEWEKCVEEGEKNKEDIVDKCYDVTTALKVCMEAHPDYYGPILKAEKAAEAKAVRELEKGKEKENEESEHVVEREGNVGDFERKEAS